MSVVLETTEDSRGRRPLPPLAAHRQQLIDSELRRFGSVSTQDLAARWGLSCSSITRDLTQLAAQGRCQRIRGGAVRRSPGARATF
ncbi:DeoR family transcriptional regulator [Jatrophihabitans telluris]|uniref:DeoR family transcriptional regulator n=1 Tax=Jatrophihabitans telluris TaxID=2038343 RepID=UPI003D3133AF